MSSYHFHYTLVKAVILLFLDTRGLILHWSSMVIYPYANEYKMLLLIRMIVYLHPFCTGTDNYIRCKTVETHGLEVYSSNQVYIASRLLDKIL